MLDPLELSLDVLIEAGGSVMEDMEPAKQVAVVEEVRAVDRGLLEEDE